MSTSSDPATANGTDSRFEQTLARLIAASDEVAGHPFQRIAFPQALQADRLMMPEELISLYHHPVYQSLSAAQRRELSLLETVNFFSINIHGERALVAGLQQRLYRQHMPWDGYEASRYLQRFIHEENSHTYMLAEFCHRYYGRVMPDTALPLDRTTLSPIGEDLLFFGRTYVLEGFLSFLNIKVTRDASLDETVRAVHHAHHGDESRHVAFDRAVLRVIAEKHVAECEPEERGRIAQQLDLYRQVAQRRLYNASLYRRIGLSGGVQLTQQVRELPQRQAIERRWMESTMAFLARLGLGVESTEARAGEVAHEIR